MNTCRATYLSIGILLIGTACAAPLADSPQTIEAAVAATVQAMVTPTLPSRPTLTPAPSATPMPTATESPTPSPLLVSVSAATNCRKGPGRVYGLVTSMLPGQVVEVVARSDVEDFYYVVSPANQDEHCWLWGEYASVEGDTSTLPVFTPEPSPTPRIGFTTYLYGFYECGARFVVLTLVNDGGTTFMTAKTRVDDITKSEILHSRIDRHPFAATPQDCPPDHGNFFPPGSAAFIVLPLKSYTPGNDAMATIKLCTQDYAGGDCVAKVAYFKLPSN